MKITTKQITGAILFLLVLLWSYAAASKFMEHRKFIFQMELSPLALIKSLAIYLSWLVPAIESLMAIALFTERYRIAGVYCSLFLLIVFEIYIAAMMLSGLHLPCTCGGVISKMSWEQHLFFNGFFIAISLFTIILNKKDKNTQVNVHDNQLKGLSRA